MEKFVKKILAVIGTTVLGALGFSSCIFIPREEYGTPTVDFKVDITVTNIDGKGIKGIKVIPADNDGTETLTTDDSGNAKRSYSAIGSPKKYKVYFEDPDGEDNGGTFARDSAEFTPTQTGKGDGHWYWGEWTAKGTKTLRNL